jgi:hypothetical protein
MRKTLGKVVLAVVIAGLLTGGIAIASAATKVRTVTMPQGTSVDVISVTGTVTEVSTASTTGASHGIMGMFRRGPAGYAKIKDNADGTVYTLELGREETAGLTMKVGDIVTVEGTSATRNSFKDLQVWTFTGADGKKVAIAADGFRGGCGMRGDRGAGQGAGRGFRGGMMGPGSSSDSPTPSNT